VPGLSLASGERVLTVDTAYGGDSFVVVDAATLGLAETGIKITNAANAQLQFRHPANAQWQHFSFCLFAGNITRDGQYLNTRAAVAIQPGKIDRSPTGTAACARMALLHAAGDMQEGDTLIVKSIIDSEFRGEIVGTTSVGDKPGIVPRLSGRAWVTGTHQYHLDPDDPWPAGYRLSDTWPRLDQ